MIREAKIRSNRRNGKQGFTLLEVAIAVFVIVIGVLALFALMSAGLDSSARAVADTQAAMYADNVFNGLHAVTLREARRGDNGKDPGGNYYWRMFWHDFASGSTNILIAAPDVWIGERVHPAAQPQRLTILGTGDGTVGTVETIRFENRPQHDSGVQGVVNHALRYRIDIRRADGTLVKDSLQGEWYADADNERIGVELRVWDGEFGDVEQQDPILLYTEFDNPGTL